MSVTVRKSSRLRFGDLITADGVEFWDMLELPDIPMNDDDIMYSTKESDRMDLLAKSFYGDPVLWWVIAAANEMELCPNDLKANTILRIPSPRYVSLELFRKARVQ